MSYEIVFHKQADSDWEKIKTIPTLKKKAISLLLLLTDNPFQYPPNFEKLCGDLKGFYSRRLNHQHRLVYEVFEKEKVVKIVRMWTHYEK
jgi:Txe/YoeB family toxin of toxin-antitoxin system